MSLCQVSERGLMNPTLFGPLAVLPRNPFFNLLDRSVLHPKLDCRHSKICTATVYEIFRLDAIFRDLKVKEHQSKQRVVPCPPKPQQAPDQQSVTKPA